MNNEDFRLCNSCNITKPLSEFTRKKSGDKIYYTHQCKQCRNKERREQYKIDESLRIKNRERVKKYQNEHKEEIRIKRADYIREYNSRYYKENKEYFKKYKNTEHYLNQQLEYRQSNKEHIREQNKKYKEINHDEILEKRKKWDKTYRNTHKEERRKYLEKNRELLNQQRMIRHRERIKTDPLYKFEKQIRGLIKSSFRRKRYKKNSRTFDIVGLNCKDLTEYLLKTYKDIYGYEWDGKEKVHIDHIIPLATANSEEEIIYLCYYENLQLLKEKDNLKKGDKLNWKINK